MKKYFISFEYYNDDINKFDSNIISMDLNNEGMVDRVKSMIQDRYPKIDIDSLTIKITNFNNIEI